VRVHALEGAGDRDAGAFRAVDAADDKHPCAALVAGAYRHDRPPSLRPAERQLLR
jgi:hypothetical protein